MTDPLIFWRKADGSETVPLLPLPATNSGFEERTDYVFQAFNPVASLAIDDEVLAPNADGTWLWTPRFFAGEVVLELTIPSGPSKLFSLDVAPDPAKMGRDIFGCMVDELWAEDPTLVTGSEPATRQIGDLGALEEPWLAFARLRRYGSEFVRSIAQIRSRPRRTLRVTRALVPAHHARYVDRQTGAALLRGPALALVSAGVKRAAPRLGDVRLDVPVPEETVDAAANRAVMALLRAVLRRTTLVADRLERQIRTESASETRTPLAARWPARKRFLDDLARLIRTALRDTPFRDVTRAEITAAGLTAIAADPMYARVWSRGWRALRHGVDASPTQEQLWISPSWEIYERWCFIRVGQLLMTSAPDWDWQRLTNPHRFIGKRRTDLAELSLQPVFRATGAATHGRWSVSKQREPDIVLTIQHNAMTRFVVLDAKYVSTRTSVLEAMTSAHVYQDSLRVSTVRSEMSFLLVPALGGASWLENPEFQRQHRVGVLPLFPGNAGWELTQLLTDLLRH